nr:reverse transcriptase domain-containing protein [Tanacetum cinerariifolium]
MLKFPVKGGIVTIRGTILIPTECASMITSSVVPSEERTRPANFKVALHPDFPDQEVAIGGTLSEKGRTNLCSILKKNLYIFAWQPSDMTGDCYPLPEIDWKVKSLCGYPFKCLLDAYKGYHQIELVEAGEEKTTFHTRQRVYCYMKKPSGLKNAGATYQRLMDSVRRPNWYVVPTGRVVVPTGRVLCSYWQICSSCWIPRSIIFFHIVGHLCPSRALKFADSRCERIFFLTHPRSRVQAAGAASAPRRILGVHFLGKRFSRAWRISFTKLVENTLSPMILDPTEALVAGLRIATRMGVKNVHVSVDSKPVANQVLGTYVAKEDNMVKYLEIVKSLLRALVQTGTSQSAQRQIHKGEGSSNGDRRRQTDLDDTVSGLLKRRSPPRRQEGGKKAPPQGRQYELMDGLLYRRSFLKPWTAVGEIVSDNGKQFSDNPFKDWCDKLNITQRFASVKHPQSNGLVERVNQSLGEGIKSRLREGNNNWVEELPYVLWAHRTMIKSSHDDTPFFITHGTEAVIPTEIGMPTYRTAAVDVVRNDEELRLNLNLLEERRERATICEANAKSKMTKYYNARVRGVTFKPGDFVYRNNDASHAVTGGKLEPKWEGPYEVTEALGDGAYKLRSMDGTTLPKTWNIANLKRYLGSNRGTGCGPANSNANGSEECTCTSRSAQRQIHKGEGSGNDDRRRRTDLDDTVSGLLKRRSPPRRQEGGKKAPPQGRQYELMDGLLYRRSFFKPWTARLSDTPSHNKTPQQPLTPITALWPFYKWGIDIAGPFSEGLEKVKFLIVVMDYFTKWIETKAVATITGGQVNKFVWDNIVCRFGIPGEIVSDNGKQFSDNPFKDWCDKLNITQRFASVKHPQSNGLVERANRSLGEGIKSRLREGNNNWVEELPYVLWAHRTMIKSSHDDMPFSITYGTEAVIPTEIGMHTYRTAAVDVVRNDEDLRLNLNLLEERHERATICEAKAKSNMTKYYNARVRGVTFKPGDFVYRSNDASHAVAGGKLEPKWEGPYEVTEALGDGAYKLRSMDGTILPRTWNIANLKRCYL